MKYILITGANGGLGLATTKYFAQRGFFVFRADVKSGEEIENTQQFILDITNINDVLTLKDKIQEITPTLYAVINLAGIFGMDSFVEIEESDFKKYFDVNFFGAYRINKTFLPLLSNGGRVLIITSEVAPLYPLPFESLYGLTKSTLDNYASALRMELNLLDIPVVVIRPGAIKTNLLGDSTRAIDLLCEKTKLYKYNAEKFRTIVNKIESKAVEPIKVAKLIFKATCKKKPRFTYSINRNPLLILLSSLPKRFQVYIIKSILKPKKSKT